MNENNDNVEVRLDGLDALIQALQDAPRGRVGVISSPRESDDGKAQRLTNAQVGAMHEFGTSKLPVRSFLRLPLTTMLSSRLEAAGFADEAKLKRLIATRSAKEIMQLILVEAESVVREAFDTGGYGTWQPSNMARKKVMQTLVESGQLRNAIASELEE